MGLIKAFKEATSSVFGDQWLEYFYCESIDDDVLITKGSKKVGNRNINLKNESNIISDGSTISINEGQCMIIVEQGKVVELSAESGAYTYRTDLEPSFFTGSLGDSIKETFGEIIDRWKHGANPSKDQRIYFVNIKEIMDNKYGTAQPIPFRVIDKNIGLDIDIALRCFGVYSYKITDPIVFYSNVAGNVPHEFRRSEIDNQLKSELMSALQPALAQLGAQGIRYSELMLKTRELSAALNDILSEDWKKLRGIEVASFAISSATASEEDQQLIKEAQRDAIFKDPTMAAAHLTGAQAQAMKDAAKNEGGGGAFMGFAGMNMANMSGGSNPSDLFALGAKKASNNKQEAEDEWVCSCGQSNTGNFCSNCGNAKPIENDWKCSCGQVNTGNFCSNCGQKKPSDDWTCSCGQSNKGKFCSNCGNKRP